MNFEPLLTQQKPIVGDGAMGTQLIAHGLTAGECGELWNRDRPKVVEAVHRSYIEAGADYVLTNTFGGNNIALARHGLAGAADEATIQSIDTRRRCATSS